MLLKFLFISSANFSSSFLPTSISAVSMRDSNLSPPTAVEMPLFNYMCPSGLAWSVGVVRWEWYPSPLLWQWWVSILLPSPGGGETVLQSRENPVLRHPGAAGREDPTAGIHGGPAIAKFTWPQQLGASCPCTLLRFQSPCLVQYMVSSRCSTGSLSLWTFVLLLD